MRQMADSKGKKASGAEPSRVKIKGDWQDAVAKAMKKIKPEEGWPKPTAMPQRSPKARKK
jgi:hypothetical protein